MKKVLIIEDDLWITKSLKLYLESSDYNVKIHNTWAWAIEKINEIAPDLIILDINLPEKNWMEICKEYREFSSTPIIMLTARDSENDRVTGLELWADDYIAKPFSPRELLARIKRILKRVESSINIEDETNRSKIINYKNIILNKQKRVVKDEKWEINLTKNEYDIFEKILEEDWEIVSRETLMKEIIWYDKYIYDRTLDTHIKNLRKKLSHDNIIITIRWKWYRLNK